MKRRKKIILAIIATLIVLGITITVVTNILVIQCGKGQCYSSVEQVPYRRVGLLLGTAPYLNNGSSNPYFTYRIEACSELYYSGKISKVLVSGDNHKKNYNEPEAMRQALIEAGVPDCDIVLDYAGFRTYDSMVRAKKVSGQDSVIVISQQWHNERAIYIARHIGLDAVAYNAKDAVPRVSKVRLTVREYLARTLMSVDLLIGHDPHFLGEPITI